MLVLRLGRIAALGPAAFLAIGAGAAQAEPNASCAAAIQEVRTAITGEGLDAAIGAYQRRVISDCLGNEQAGVARALALSHLPVIDAAQRNGASVQDRLQLVRRALTLDSTAWQLHEVNGDLLSAVPEFEPAARAYETALTRMDDASPRTDELALVARKAEQTRLLAGRVGGLPSNRNFEALAKPVSPVPQPILFETGTDRFMRGGQVVMAEMLRMLREAGMPPIRVVGHTDPRGDERVNLPLSRARARAAVRYLKEAGYPSGQVVAEGRGSLDPYQPVPIPGVTYTQEQRWQMDRRVDVIFR